MTTISSTSSSSALVEQLIYIDSAPIRNNETKIKALNSKKDLINSINTQVSSLQTAAEDLYKALSSPSKTITESKEGIASVTISDNNFAGNIELDVKQLATSTSVGGDKFEGAIGINGSFKISIGETELTVEVSEKDTIKSIRDKINSNKDFGASASIIDGRLVLTSKETGESNFTFEDNDGILNKIGITQDDGSAKNILQKGQNALFNVNGIDIEHKSNSVEDVIDGVTLNLKDIGKVSMKIEEDVDSLYESVEKFIETYNKTLSMISTELKKEGGPLRGDSTLNKLKSDLRNAMSSKGGGLYSLLSNIGIEFSSTNYGKDAQLEIKDKDKLKEALSKNKQDVLELFVQDNNDNGKLDSNDGGLLGTLNNYLELATSTSSSSKGLFKIKIESIENSIKSLEDRNVRLQSSIDKKRAIYEKQFLYMDTYIERMNSQLTGLSSMLAQNNSSYY